VLVETGLNCMLNQGCELERFSQFVSIGLLPESVSYLFGYKLYILIYRSEDPITSLF